MHSYLENTFFKCIICDFMHPIGNYMNLLIIQISQQDNYILFLI